jgi:ribosomal protein S18 acetylase RimI-like enzyme
MNSSLIENSKVAIRPVQYRDLEAIKILVTQERSTERDKKLLSLVKQLERVRKWYGLLKFLSFFPNPCQYQFPVYVAEQLDKVRGSIQIAPFNSTRTTWRVERIATDKSAPQSELLVGKQAIGSQLLRYCFETIWEARTWLLEVNINDKETLALYRENGFQPLAEMTYWAIEPETIAQLAGDEPDLPNLLPVSNADAQLLYQLDTVSMPPLLRQVFDRHIKDFKTGLLKTFLTKLNQWFGNTQIVRGYVFEPQRKAAIGYFELELCTDGSQPHEAQLTVHPAYTWLYPQLIAQMSRIVQTLPPQSLELASADYQPEREEYLEKIGAAPVERTLLMSRSVWHKLKESKPLEALQLSEMLQGLQPARTPIPSRMSWLKPIGHQDLSRLKSGASANKDSETTKESSKLPSNGHHV